MKLKATYKKADPKETVCKIEEIPFGFFVGIVKSYKRDCTNQLFLKVPKYDNTGRIFGFVLILMSEKSIHDESVFFSTWNINDGSNKKPTVTNYRPIESIKIVMREK